MNYLACPTIDPSTTLFSPQRSWYHENIEFKETLVITAGDSWTWGDSLGRIDFINKVYDCPTRTTSIYGYLLSKKLDADLINVGKCGGANIEIHDHVLKVLDTLEISYKQIYVIFTLTENGRESFFDQLWIPETTNSLNDFLQNYEYNMFNSFKKNFVEKYNNIKFLFARNFTYSFSDNIPILGSLHATKNWVDCLSDYQNKPNYPDQLRMLSSMSYVPLHKYLKSVNLYKKFKFDFMEHYADAELAVEWLLASDLNYKKATKHPTEVGHQIWADYLYQQLQ